MFQKNKRQLCLITAAFLMGILLAEKREQIWPALAICLTAGLFFDFIGNTVEFPVKQKMLLVLLLSAMVFSGYLLCTYQTRQYMHRTDALRTDADVTAVGIVYRKESKAKTCGYYIKESSCLMDGKTLPGGRLIAYAENDRIPVGSAVRIEGTLQLFEPAPNEGNFDAAFYYRTQNITCSIFADRITAEQMPVFSLKESLYQLQKKISAVYSKYLNERDAGILCQLVLGNRSQMDAEVKAQYQANGIAHILAISGLHISLIGMGIFRFLRKLKQPLLPACLISAGVVICFALMSGSGVSTSRAVCMYLILLGAQITGRRYDMANALALAALIVLLRNPLALFQSGFLFSFGAILGILLVVPVFDALSKKKIFRRFASILGIQIFLMPLTAWFYFEIPVYGVFLNLLVIPLCGWLLGIGMLGGVLGSFGIRLAGVVLFPCHIILELYARAMRFCEYLPGHLLLTGKPSIWLIFFLYLSEAGLLFFWWQAAPRKRTEGKWEKGAQESKRAFLFLPFRKKRQMGIPVVMLLLTVLLWMPHREAFQIDFLDVGQGDGICITAGNGAHLFLDGGSNSEKKAGSRRILPFLKSHRIGKMDVWIVTHADADHISGLLELLKEGYPMQKILLADAMPRDDAWQELVLLAKKNNTQICYVSAGSTLGLGSDARMQCLYPSERAQPDADPEDRNAFSQVWMLEKAGKRVLFTGDIGEAQEQILLQQQIAEADLLKVAHHGSKNSSCEAFLKAVHPKVAVISCGKKNRYGHPHPDALKRLKTIRARVLTTMEVHQIRAVWEKGEVFLEYPCTKSKKV